MKKIATIILVFTVILSGCHSPSTSSVNENQNQKKKAPPKEKVLSKEEIEKEQDFAKNDFDKMIQAVDKNDKEQFLSFQNDADKLFYKEQDAWLLGVKQKRREGWTVSEVINDITVTSQSKGSIELQVNMKRKDETYKNRITYPIVKVDGRWKINDLPFKKKIDGPIHFYYLPTLQWEAESVYKDVEKLIDVYKEQFIWEPKEVNIKLYDSLEALSASVPWESLYGVSTPISLKFFVEKPYTDITFSLMKHEVVHSMLVELSNDNAPNFMQEGLAMFISDAIKNEPSGTITFNLDGASTERENIILKNIKKFKPISQLNMNYTENAEDIYGLGYLVTNYLITNYGMDKYLEMLNELKKEATIDSENENKEQIIFKRAINAMEKTYGPINKLSKAYVEYFNMKK
ncbi:hypothetical protein ACQKCU_02790 [Heyndrickxia sporothermodurans]